MNNNLDFDPPTHKHLNKAKTLFYILLACFFFTLIVAVFGDVLGLLRNYKELLMALPFLLIIVLAPFALFHIIKSYRTKEVYPRKIWYLIGILFFNALLLFMILSIVMDVAGNFAHMDQSIPN